MISSVANFIAAAGQDPVNVTRRANTAKNLRTLFADLTTIVLPDIGIDDLSLDSRQIQPGAAFIALPGWSNAPTAARTHGMSFAHQAVQSGARAVLWEPADQVAPPPLPAHVAVVAIPGLSALLGTLADRFFAAPSQSVTVHAVTGTNGKTTTAYLLAGALSRLGVDAAYAGTLGYGRIDSLQPDSLQRGYTTPDCITLHREIAQLRDAGVAHLGVEVSSHALDQQRIAGLRVDTAVFTNLTHDHLDYHGTLAAYRAAKARLFAWPNLRHAVINVEDTFGRELASRQARAASLTLYGRTRYGGTGASGFANARQVIATHVTERAAGLRIAVASSWGDATIDARCIGDFNVDNLLAVLGVLLGAGFSIDEAARALEQCGAPPGRMEAFIGSSAGSGKPLAIVDYAHTPDALDKALLAARRHCSGKLYCVFGCGGDRDTAKRPLMGAIAERRADVAIVTDDNPRTEDGAAIVAGILTGMLHPARAVIERDRAAAIEYAIGRATDGDVVLIAGKGHEDYQIIGLEKRHCSDREIVGAAMRSGT